MQQRPLHRIKYEFVNGITCEFFITTNFTTNPIHRVEWSKKLTKKLFQKMHLEYYTICIPYVYQRIANFLQQPILYVDSSMIVPPITFKPEELNLS